MAYAIFPSSPADWPKAQNPKGSGGLVPRLLPTANSEEPKNWLFAGSDNGGRTGATLASLVASCKRHALDPFAYLRDVFTRIAGTPISELD